jgi:large subunit ribosomal protein L6
MSRKGRMPIPLPKGVEVSMKGQDLMVKGPKGTLNQKVVPGVKIAVAEGNVTVGVAHQDRRHRALHGLYRALVSNMVTGVAKGFTKVLEMVGVGYRSAVSGQSLDLSLGFSHPTKVTIPQGLEIKIEKGTVIQISGANKQQVGQFAAQVRAIRPPEPYQGKGVRYKDERVRRKAGKTAKKA